MRRLLSLIVLAAVAAPVVAPVVSAQVPPSIKKPIEMARKNANATNQQTRMVEQAGSPAATYAPMPAANPAAVKPTAQAKAAPTKAAATGKAAAAQDSSKVTFYREVFGYDKTGRRDPFASPIETGEIRPLIADLRVTGIIFDARGRNSVAVMRDMSTQEQYRVKTGQILGRAKVAQIKPQEVVMTIDEYGFSRQETLFLQKTQQTKRTP